MNICEGNSSERAITSVKSVNKRKILYKEKDRKTDRQPASQTDRQRRCRERNMYVELLKCRTRERENKIREKTPRNGNGRAAETDHVDKISNEKTDKCVQEREEQGKGEINKKRKRDKQEERVRAIVFWGEMPPAENL